MRQGRPAPAVGEAGRAFSSLLWGRPALTVAPGRPLPRRLTSRRERRLGNGACFGELTAVRSDLRETGLGARGARPGGLQAGGGSERHAGRARRSFSERY